MPDDETTTTADETTPGETEEVALDGEATEATTPPEPEKPAVDPKTERVAARLVLAKKAETRRAAAEAKLREERQAFERDRAELARVKADLDDKMKLLSRLPDDPRGVLAKLGADFDKSLEAFATKTPADMEIEKLRTEVEAIRRKDEERARALEEQASRAHVARAEDAYRAAALAHIESAAEKYPMTYEYDDAEIREAAFRVAEAHYKETGQILDYAAAAEKLEASLKAREEAKRAKREKRFGVGAGEGSSSDGGRQVSRPGRRTLANSDASERGSTQRDMTDEEIDAWSLQQLRAARRSAK